LRSSRSDMSVVASPRFFFVNVIGNAEIISIINHLNNFYFILTFKKIISRIICAENSVFGFGQLALCFKMADVNNLPIVYYIF